MRKCHVVDLVSPLPKVQTNEHMGTGMKIFILSTSLQRTVEYVCMFSQNASVDFAIHWMCRFRLHEFDVARAFTIQTDEDYQQLC